MAPSNFKKAFHWDLARQIERPDYLLKWIPRYADWGYDQVYLYLEDAFDFPSVPGIARPHAFTPRDMDRIVAKATRCGMQVVPLVPLLGHAAYLVKTPEMVKYSEMRDAKGKPIPSGQVCPLHSGILKLAEKLVGDLQSYCTAGIIHMGLDESFDIGKCPACRKEVESIGLDRHFANYIARLNGVSAKMGLRMGMWADMLYYTPKAIDMLPKDVIAYDWYYYPFKRLPRVEMYNFAEVDLTRSLREAGLDVYGCPCSNTFCFELLPPFLHRLENVATWWRYAHARKAQGLLITSWCQSYASAELNTVGDAAAASVWLNPGVSDPREMLALGWQRAFGKGAKEAAFLLAASQKYTEGGYHGWQTRMNWKALANEDSLALNRQKERHYFGLMSRAVRQKVATPLRATLVFRHYVARKDLFLQENSQLLLRARKLLGKGDESETRKCIRQLLRSTEEMKPVIRAAKRATREVWKRTRPLAEVNPNERICDEDWKKLTLLRSFLQTADKKPAQLWEPNPLTGRWQLLFWVRNFAPTLQGVAVEMKLKNGEWKTMHSLYSIEFTAAAAQPRADFRHPHSVAFDWKGKTPLQLRLAVRGLGKLEIYQLRLTNGAMTLAPSKIKAGKGPVQSPQRLLGANLPGAILGIPAPHKGFPSIDWNFNQAAIDLEFSAA